MVSPTTPLSPDESPTRAHAPLYRRVVHALRDEILKGVHPIGSQLPTEAQLCARFDVSRHTVREALRELRMQGLVSSRRGSGTTVIHPGEAAHGYVHQVGSLSDLSQYAAARWDILSQERLQADAALAGRLECAPGTAWLRIRACRYVRDAENPVGWTELYLHGDYAQIARLIGKQERPIYELVQELYGDPVDDVTQTLRAREVPDAVARHLRLRKGAMVIEVERRYRLADGKVIEVSTNLYPADEFRFSIKLRRTVA